MLRTPATANAGSAAGVFHTGRLTALGARWSESGKSGRIWEKVHLVARTSVRLISPSVARVRARAIDEICACDS